MKRLWMCMTFDQIPTMYLIRWNFKGNQSNKWKVVLGEDLAARVGSIWVQYHAPKIIHWYRFDRVDVSIRRLNEVVDLEILLINLLVVSVSSFQLHGRSVCRPVSLRALPDVALLRGCNYGARVLHG